MAFDSERAWLEGALGRFEAPLLRYAASLVGAAAAPDVVQDTFLALCRAQREKVADHLGPWLFVVCKHQALELLRDRRRLEPLEEDEMTNATSDEPWLGPEQKHSLERVQVLLNELPERQRQAVILKFAAGLSYKEIAEVMDVSVTHVGVILHTALGRLRDRWAEPAVALSARSL